MYFLFKVQQIWWALAASPVVHLRFFYFVFTVTGIQMHMSLLLPGVLTYWLFFSSFGWFLCDYVNFQGAIGHFLGAAGAIDAFFFFFFGF